MSLAVAGTESRQPLRPPAGRNSSHVYDPLMRPLTSLQVPTGSRGNMYRHASQRTLGFSAGL
jgi:hypothetical protein